MVNTPSFPFKTQRLEMSHQKVVAPNGQSIRLDGKLEETGSAAPLIVVSNRLPFVLKRDSSGILRRSHRYSDNPFGEEGEEKIATSY